MTLILLALSATVAICIMAWYFAIYAFPLMVGLAGARLAYAADAGLFLSLLAGIATASVAVGVILALLLFTRHPAFRIIALILFAIPAAVAGYALIYGIARHAFEIPFFTHASCTIAALCTAIAAAVNVLGLATSSVDAIAGKARR